MKTTLLFLLLLGMVPVWAQTSSTQDRSPLLTAFSKLSKGNKAYDPAGGIAILRREAQKGDPNAMSALAWRYVQGRDVPQNVPQGIKLYALAADKGHGSSCLDLGLRYQEGNEVPQDFARAVHYFEKGVNKGDRVRRAELLYRLGYMKYKGLGCRQSYEEAAALFKRGVELSSRGSMYMLGLCYRNGYGITLNTDSARYWLVKAAELGSPLAKEELQEAEPENAMALQHAKAPSAYVLNEKKAGQGFERVKHNVEKNKIAGVYTGYIIRYDWSGTYIIGRDKLTLKLLRQGNIITGEWTEGENLSAGVQASLSDSALVFQNTVYKRVDHYSAKKETGFEFRNAHLKLAASGDSVFLAGNIQLYSQRLREPEKPVYVSLVRTEQGEKKKKASFEKASEIQSQQMASNEVKIYPNPFSSSFQAGFTLTQPATVQLLLYAMNGQEVFRNTRQLPAGSHVLELKADVPAGTYIFKLVYGNTIKNSIIIKQ